MKLRKRFTALLLALLLCLSLLAGCGPKDEPQTDDGQNDGQKEEEITVDRNFEDNAVALGASAYDSDLLGTGAVGENGAAASASSLASQIAVKIMEQGGNAVDAAVAMIYAVGLLEPAASGMGGAGQMVVYLAESNEYVVIEYMTQAGEAAIPGKLDTDTASTPVPAEAIAIPGVVHGTMTALEKYGTMSAREVLQPVIDLARGGFPVTARWNSNIEGRYDNLAAYPYTMGLYTDGGFLWNEGDIITNNDLADTLELIAKEGIKGFYDSDFTDKMVDFIQQSGGVLTRADFAQYTSVIREPISTTYRDYQVYTVGGPSNGGAALLEALNICENFDLSGYGYDSWESVQIINDAFAIAYHDALCFMADPDYYNLPVQEMISKEYAAQRASEISVGTSLKGAKAGNLTVTQTDKQKQVEASYTVDQGGTTHMAVMDSKGNVVSTTNTNGINFGSALAVPGTGFIFSAHLGNLSNSKGAVINKCQPYIRVRSTMCPAIVADSSGKPVLAIGSPGNWALVNATLNGIINYIDFDMDAASATLAARSWRDGVSQVLTIEGRYSQETLNGLAKAGFSVEVEPLAYGSHVGCIAAVEQRADGKYYAIGDYRRYYGSAAY